MRTAESFSMPRDLVKQEDVDPDAGDAMIAKLPEYLDYTWDDSEFDNAYCLWRGKTQENLIICICLRSHALSK